MNFQTSRNRRFNIQWMGGSGAAGLRSISLHLIFSFVGVSYIYIYIYFLSLSLPYFPRELRVAFEIEDGFNKVLEIFIDSKNFSPIKGRFIR